MNKIRTHKDLDVYRLAFEAAMENHRLTITFPKEEKYSLTDQIRRSSRSVCANISEAFRKRKYPKAFVAKFSDAEGEAAETQTWLEFSLSCEYLDESVYQEWSQQYDFILGKLVNMSLHPDNWTF